MKTCWNRKRREIKMAYEDPVCIKLTKDGCEGKKPCIRWDKNGKLRNGVRFIDCPDFRRI
jgi:hypothetical protein